MFSGAEIQVPAVSERSDAVSAEIQLEMVLPCALHMDAFCS